MCINFDLLLTRGENACFLQTEARQRGPGRRDRHRIALVPRAKEIQTGAETIRLAKWRHSQSIIQRRLTNSIQGSTAQQ